MVQKAPLGHGELLSTVAHAIRLALDDNILDAIEWTERVGAGQIGPAGTGVETDDESITALNILATAKAEARSLFGSASSDEWASAIAHQIADSDLRAVLRIVLADYVEASQKRGISAAADEYKREHPQ